MLTAERLRELLYYHPSSGDFVWLIRPRLARIAIGDRAGTKHPHGYLQITIDGQRYLAHRLAWFYVHGGWPTGELDHKNLRKSDAAFDNLREATRSQNNQNISRPRHNTSGIKGVRLKKQTGKWVATISIDGVNRHLGYFFTKDEASKAYRAAAQEYHREFARAE